MHDRYIRLKEQIQRVYLGSPRSVELLLCTMFARGHALLEDVPGVGKTLLASSLARSVDASFSRVQLTPDMMPADLIGVTTMSPTTHETKFQKGPVFASIVLADEINRTTPRTQSALLEAMSEGEVSVDGMTHALPEPFMVVATQNPNDFIGTYPLPENQLDRFLMRVSLGYPDEEAERELLEIRPAQTRLGSLAPIIHAEDVIGIQREVDAVRMSESVRIYIVELARATRESEDIDVGLSPRGSLALAQAARAMAWIHARDHVVPDDVYDLLIPVCAHRLVVGGSSSGAQWARAADMIRACAENIRAPT